MTVLYIKIIALFKSVSSRNKSLEKNNNRINFVCNV